LANYEIYLNNSLLTTTTNTSYSLTGLSAQTSYSVLIKAVDINGNTSEGPNGSFSTIQVLPAKLIGVSFSPSEVSKDQTTVLTLTFECDNVDRQCPSRIATINMWFFRYDANLNPSSGTKNQWGAVGTCSGNICTSEARRYQYGYSDTNYDILDFVRVNHEGGVLNQVGPTYGGGGSGEMSVNFDNYKLKKNYNCAGEANCPFDD
jgi:hypothetical protein